MHANLYMIVLQENPLLKGGCIYSITVPAIIFLASLLFIARIPSINCYKTHKKKKLCTLTTSILIFQWTFQLGNQSVNNTTKVVKYIQLLLTKICLNLE